METGTQKDFPELDYCGMVDGVCVPIPHFGAVLPIAHNAGEFWPRHSWIKWPGTIRVVIGKPIDPAGKKPEQIIEEVATWIVSEGERISDKSQLQRIGIL